MKTTELHRGDIFFVNLNPVLGSEQGGTRPALVIQNDLGNQHSPTIIIAPISSQLKKQELPTHVLLPDEIGLPEKSMVLLEQIRTIDRDRLGTYVSTADNETMAAINTAIRVSLGLVPPKPPQRPNGLTLCLCPSCASYFYQSKDHFIRRVDPNAIIKEPCDYCRLRQGYDYTISPMHGHRLPHS